MLTLVWLFQLCHGGLLAASTLEKCTEGDKLECDKKLVLTLTLESGQLQTERVEMTIESADTGDGEEKLETPLKIEWSKEAAEWRYPLKYIQSVNSQLKETIIHTQSCVAEREELEDATCGYWRKQSGAYIDYSEGFCCVCDVFGNSWNGRTTRGKVDCSDVVSGWFTHSAHCLRVDDLWYAVFEIEPPIMEYEISIFATVGNSTEVISLKHSNVVGQTEVDAKSKSPYLYAELIGDLAGAKATPLYEDKFLFVPSTAGHERHNVSGNMLTYAMLLDKTHVNLAGTECDKIGVSHYAFKHQPDKCLRNAGDCLRNQPNHFHESDIERYERGERMRYMLSNECGGAFALRTTRSKETLKNKFDMRCAIYNRHTTLVKLEIAADNLRMVSSLARGHLRSVEVHDFEAMSGAGEIIVVVNSTAPNAAEFILSVECSEGVLPEASPRFSLAPKMEETKVIPLSAQSSEGSAALNCTLELKDVVGTVLDVATAAFTITQVEEECGAQCGSVDGEDGITKVFVEPDTSCPCSWFAVWCHVLYLKYCYTKLLLALMLYGGFPAVSYLAYIGKLSVFFRLFRRKKEVRKAIQRRSTYHAPNHGHPGSGSHADRTRKVARESRRLTTNVSHRR